MQQGEAVQGASPLVPGWYRCLVVSFLPSCPSCLNPETLDPHLHRRHAKVHEHGVHLAVQPPIRQPPQYSLHITGSNTCACSVESASLRWQYRWSS